MPSKKSRENNFYYSNPTNRFWKILSVIFSEDFLHIDNIRKKELLLSHNIALFDVYKSCEMRKPNSSLDSNIFKQEFNNIPKLIENTNILKIYITSKKAYYEFIKHYGEYFNSINIPIISLPSPSSANRSIYKTDEGLIEAWRKLINKEDF